MWQYANNMAKRRSTTGYAFTYSGDTIVYRSKKQSLTALSSTEAEFIAVVTAAKTAKHIRSILADLISVCHSESEVSLLNQYKTGSVETGAPPWRAGLKTENFNFLLWFNVAGLLKSFQYMCCKS